MDRPVVLENWMDGRVQELCDGHVLGVLEADDRRELDALLAQTGDGGQGIVRKAMRNSEEIAGCLAWGAPPVRPPDRLRRHVLGLIEAETARAGSGNVVAFSSPARRRTGPLMAGLGWAAAAGLGLAAFLLNTRAQTAERNLAEVQQESSELRTAITERDQVLRIIGARDARAIRLVTTAPEAPQFRAYWSEGAGLMLAGNRVATPKPGRTLQLWIVPKSGQPVSAGVFAPTAAGEVLLIAANSMSPDRAQALAISEEPVGGSPQPTTQPAWIGAVGGF